MTEFVHPNAGTVESANLQAAMKSLIDDVHQIDDDAERAGWFEDIASTLAYGWPTSGARFDIRVMYALRDKTLPAELVETVAIAAGIDLSDIDLDELP